MLDSKIEIFVYYMNTFGSIGHARFLAIMEDLDYQQDVVALVGKIYSQYTTRFIDEYLSKTQPIPIQRGAIQGDPLSSRLFIIFLEPLLIRLQRRNNGYSFRSSHTKISSATYADDFMIICNKLNTTK